MNKAKALELLGGSVGDAAEAVGVTPSAVSQWPDELPKRIADRVLAALARKHLPPELIGAEAMPPAATVPKAADCEANRPEAADPSLWPLQRAADQPAEVRDAA